ncbi:MAG: hypothetical protein V3V82_03280 [Acidimicrobiia bacterium]
MTLTHLRIEASVTQRRQLGDVISVRIALAVGILWVVLVGLVFSIAPEPVGDPTAVAVTVSVMFELALMGTLAGLLALRRWGLLVSMGAAGVMLAAAALCSLGGHTGAWLVAQYLAAATLFVVGRAAFRQA